MSCRNRAAARRGPGGLAFLLLILALVAAPLAGAAEGGGEDQKQNHAHGEEHDPHDDHGEGHDEEGHGEGGHGGGHHDSRLTDEKIPLQLDGFPQRPKPILELGEPYLGTGTLDPGIQLPTGAVWQPALLAFGTFRSSIQSFESDGAPAGTDSRITEWTNRLDLFLNLQLSGSERLVVGVRALDQDGRFTSYFLEHPDPDLDSDFQDELNLDIEALYFEGDFGEIFPNLDIVDSRSLDIGFSVGRQSLFFQEGILINDTIDGFGLTRNTLQPPNTSNFRATFFYGWNSINAGALERDADLFGLLTSTDFPASTLDFDVVWVSADDGSGDLVSGGLSAVQRLGKTNSAFRIFGSFADQETPFSTDGALLFTELSWTPPYGHDHVYATGFLAIDEFSSAARAPSAGGPLGRAGINFASVGLGSYGAPLSSRARDVVGGAFGYQKFLAGNRKQWIVELGARIGTSDDVDDAVALTSRFQSAIGQHLVLVVDGFVGHRNAAVDTSPYGGRLELLLKF